MDPDDAGGRSGHDTGGAERPGPMTRATGQAAVIAIMARSPDAAPHAIKTRLRTVVPDEGTRASVYRAFLSDTIRLARTIDRTDLRVAFTPEGGPSGFDALGIGAAELIEQRGADLGARERALFDDLFAAGYAVAIVMGSDFPTLPPSVLEDARGELVRHPTGVVLGPAADGGYYLIGLSSPAVSGLGTPDVFSGIRWSTSHTLADTRARAAELGRPVALIAEWYDVDDEVGWRRLVENLRDPAVATRAPATARAVRTIHEPETSD